MTRDLLTEEYITAHADTVDWVYVSEEINIRNFSDDFFHTFNEELNWYSIDNRSHERKVLTTEFFKKFSKYMDNMSWYENGVLHRDRGPATIWTCGKREWYKNGVRHREDGPAMVDGEIEEWYLDDVHYTELEFLTEMRKRREKSKIKG